MTKTFRAGRAELGPRDLPTPFGVLLCSPAERARKRAARPASLRRRFRGGTPAPIGAQHATARRVCEGLIQDVIDPGNTREGMLNETEVDALRTLISAQERKAA